MVLRCILVVLCAASTMLILPASADTWKDESSYGFYGKNHHKNKHQNRYTKHRLPPWAAVRVSLSNQPGFDREDEPAEAEVPKVEFLLASKQIGIFSGECNREAVAALMDSVIAGVFGKEINRNIDSGDTRCANHALERAQDGQVITWDNPNTGHRYSIIPYQSFQQDDGRYCRKYRAAVNAGSSTKYYGETACRTDDGVWERLPSS